MMNTIVDLKDLTIVEKIVNNETILTIMRRGIIVKSIHLDDKYHFRKMQIHDDKYYLIGSRFDGGNDIASIVVLDIYDFSFVMSADIFTSGDNCLIDSISIDGYIYAVGYCSDNHGIDYSGVLLKIDSLCNVVNVTKHAAGKSTCFTTIESTNKMYRWCGKYLSGTIMKIGGSYSTNKHYQGSDLMIEYDTKMTIIKRSMEKSRLSEMMEEAVYERSSV